MSWVSAQKYRHYSSTFAAQATSCSRHVDQPPQSFWRRWRCESAGRRGSWCRPTAADVDRRLTTRGCRRRLDRTVPGRWDTWTQSAPAWSAHAVLQVASADRVTLAWCGQTFLSVSRHATVCSFTNSWPETPYNRLLYGVIAWLKDITPISLFQYEFIGTCNSRIQGFTSTEWTRNSSADEKP